MKNYQVRQGDIYPEAIDKLPKGLKKKNNNVIVHSDSTLHDHTLKSGTVYVDRNGELYLDVPRKTQIVHTEDHNPVDLPRGVYKVIRQREYLAKDMTRVVVD